MLTDGGCNLHWPAALRPPRLVSRLPVLSSMWSSGGRMKVPVLGPTGSRREWVVAGVVSAVAVVGMLGALVGLASPSAQVLGRW